MGLFEIVFVFIYEIVLKVDGVEVLNLVYWNLM